MRFCLARSILKFLPLLLIVVGGCLNRWVDAPEATEDGHFLVHVVRTPDESISKLLTWYTGTTLSQPLVFKYNPYLAERDVRVGDRVMIPVEVVANDRNYHQQDGTSAPLQPTAVPNLLMGEDVPNLLMQGKSPTSTPSAQIAAEVSPSQTPPISSRAPETFDADTDPDPIKSSNSASGQQDMPPPGLEREFEGS